jgi:hypothetical protein
VSAGVTTLGTEQPARRFLPRWAIYLMVPGFLGPLLILGFIFVSETAHDETRCPYQTLEVRPLSASVSVREDRRSCLWSVEERRFSVLRGPEEHALGRRRFDSAAFGRGYGWTASLSPDGEVKVQVHNVGHGEATFREGSKDEQAADARKR